MKSNLRSMLGLRALAVSALAAYLLLSLCVRAAQHLDWAPEGSFMELVVARVALEPME